MEIKVPDIGDFDAVEVIEVLVSVGDQVEENQDILVVQEVLGFLYLVLSRIYLGYSRFLGALEIQP